MAAFELAASVVTDFPAIRAGNECSICVEPVEVDDVVLVCSKCGFAHHWECSLQWFQVLVARGQHPNCPLCRSEARADGFVMDSRAPGDRWAKRIRFSA